MSVCLSVSTLSPQTYGGENYALRVRRATLKPVYQLFAKGLTSLPMQEKKRSSNEKVAPRILLLFFLLFLSFLRSRSRIDKFPRPNVAEMDVETMNQRGRNLNNGHPGGRSTGR